MMPRSALRWFSLIHQIDLPETESETMPFGLDPQHPQNDLVAFLDDVARMHDVSVAQLADVDQTFDTVLELRESAKRR